jgi:aminomethyltransferase
MVQELKKTPLAETHEALGARMVDFGGWFMPVQYSGLVDEHRAVRERVGLFDVSHMGEIRVRGEGALDFLSYLTVNDPTTLMNGQAQYTVMVNERGGVIDDLLIYRFAADDYLLVVNASTQDKDLAWIQKQAADFAVTVVSESDATAQIAVQGPQAESVLGRLTDEDLSGIAYYHFTEGKVAGIDAIISRTGYTGEDGFECYVPAGDAVTLWHALMEAGKPEDIRPAGLGARDSLRLEARMHLYGQDMDEDTSVLEAGLGWVTKLKKPVDFIGKAALIAQKKAGLTRKLVGFVLDGKGIARHGYPVVDEAGETVGVVTSGTHSPTLGKAIGLAYVPTASAKPGTALTIRVRKKDTPATVFKGPFYKRS